MRTQDDFNRQLGPRIINLPTVARQISGGIFTDLEMKGLKDAAGF